MIKKRETTNAQLRDQTAASRRDFVKAGAAAGLGAAILRPEGRGTTGPRCSSLDYEADVIGAGAPVGPELWWCKSAHDLGRAMCWFWSRTSISVKPPQRRQSSFGGGDHVQERDRLGLPDPDGWLTAPLLAKEDLTHDPEMLFRDTTETARLPTIATTRAHSSGGGPTTRRRPVSF